MAALRERVDADGLTLTDELAFVDDGYSEATLIRPELERLHDAIAAGAVDQLYVLESDRLARKYAYQILLVDEFKRAGIEVIFLNRKLAQTPEDERAKILERGRRGERQAAKAGEISVLGHAPYGYRYVSKAEGGGPAARFFSKRLGL